MMKRILASVMLSVLLITSPVSLLAATPEVSGGQAAVTKAHTVEEKTPITIFERLDCAHCKAEKAFLTQLKLERDDFRVIFHNVKTEEGRAKWLQLAELEGLSKVTPITLVGNQVIVGFGTAETTGKVIENILDASKGKKTMTFEEFYAAGGSQGGAEKIVAATCAGEDVDPLVPCGEETANGARLTYEIPFFGKINLAEYSLPALSSVLGLIDGFNPCAMWVLVTFLIVLIQAGDRKKMWTIAGIFILAEAIMYYMILTFWMTTWDFVGLDEIVTPIVGLVAIGGGVFFLYEWRTSNGSCKVTNSKQRTKTVNKINALVNAEMTIATIGAVLLLAFSVNIIEFACSIGIPQAFTKILEMNNLPLLETHGYMGLYILFYMIDDLIVFGIALWSFEKLGLTTKYVKFSNLIGGLLMLILGAILIFNPELLVFNL